MTVTFSIRNVTDDLVKTVMLRKFFQMVFVGNNRRSLHIYTATVIGGYNAPEQTDNNLGTKSQGSSNDTCVAAQSGQGEKQPKTEYISQLDKLKEFCIKFEFVVTGNDDNDVLSIISENVTDEEHGFLTQINCIQQVWGKQCKVLKSDQTELIAKYREFTGAGETEPDKKIKRKLAGMSQSSVLWIEDKNKCQEPEMFSLAVPGHCEPENYFREKVNLQGTKRNRYVEEGSERASYCITVPEPQRFCKGIELLNWVKTTIQFKDRLTDHNFNFCIKKERTKATQFIAPDFTWYFSPPVRSFINHESSCAETSWWKKGVQGQCDIHELCHCPIKPDAKAPYTSKRYDNVINPVANKTTVNFFRWIHDEMISYRQKYRIAAKNIFPRPESFDDIRELNIFIDTSDEHSRGNRQYVLGLLISFALAFGIDKTRLGEAQKYFPLEKLFLADTWWLALIISLSMNTLVRPSHSIHKKIYVQWRKWNIISALLWVIFVFCVDRSEWLMYPVSTYIANPATFNMILQSMFLLILVSNLIYVVVNIIVYHDPILSGLFDDDIL